MKECNKSLKRSAIKGCLSHTEDFHPPMNLQCDPGHALSEAGPIKSSGISLIELNGHIDDHVPD